MLLSDEAAEIESHELQQTTKKGVDGVSFLDEVTMLGLGREGTHSSAATT